MREIDSAVTILRAFPARVKRSFIYRTRRFRPTPTPPPDYGATITEKLRSIAAGARGKEEKHFLNTITRFLNDVSNWKPAPNTMPTEMIDGFSMGGRVPIRRVFRDDTIIKVHGNGDDTRLELFFEAMLYPKAYVDHLIERVRQNNTFLYGQTDTWLYESFRKYPIKGKRVAVLGSGSPVYEAICLAYGGKPITVEYQVRLSDDKRLRFLSPEQFSNGDQTVDVALSVSSFEHDGLGRYGDPLDPDGDLKAMANVAKVLPRNGLLYLTVPFQHDLTLWNVNRHYGPLRAPLLLKDFTLIDVFGAPNGLFRSLDPLVIDGDAWGAYFDELGPNQAPEWVLVLRNDKIR